MQNELAQIEFASHRYIFRDEEWDETLTEECIMKLSAHWPKLTKL